MARQKDQTARLVLEMEDAKHKMFMEQMEMDRKQQVDRVKIDAMNVTASPLTINTAPAAIDHQKWLDDTQNMRVVALNEAIQYATSMSNSMTASDITRMASIFANFLTHGKTP